MGRRITVGGVKLNITDPNLGAGGQGKAMKAALISDPAIEVVVKEIPATPEATTRTKSFVSADLPLKNPFIAGPLAMESNRDVIWHVAPLGAGVDLESDKARSFPELLEMAHHFSCQWAALEEHGIAHGDLAPSNTLVSDTGLVTLIDLDNAFIDDPNVPVPNMAGQRMMFAPEIRTHSLPPNIESDRFAAAVMLSMMLLSRHPADQWASPPVELDKAMTTGQWPERSRVIVVAETPIEAIGTDLCKLFDQSFSLDPTIRPGAEEWRRGLLSALQNCWIHKCGHSFVANGATSSCAWCGEAVSIKDTSDTLLIIVPGIQGRFRTPLKDGDRVQLGRANLAGLPTTVSSRHLEIMRLGKRLFLRHTGSNPTLIQQEGQWWKLDELWLNTSEIEATPLALKLADTDVSLQM